MFFILDIRCFQRRVVDFIGVVANVVLNAIILWKNIISGIQVIVIVFQSPPEPFHPDIVQRSSFSVNRILYPLLFEELGPDSAGILAALIWVQNFRFAVSENGFLQDFLTPRCCQQVADTLSDDFSTVYIHDRSQVHKAISHRNEGNVSAPYLVGTLDL